MIDDEKRECDGKSHSLFLLRTDNLFKEKIIFYKYLR